MKYTQKHIDILSDIIREEHLTSIRLRPKKSAMSSYCSVKGQSITIGTKDTKLRILLAMSHETGHLLSARQGHSIPSRTGILYNWGVLLNQKDGAKILAEERRAFRLGFSLMEENGIEVSEEMLSLRDELMQGHERKVASILERKKR